MLYRVLSGGENGEEHDSLVCSDGGVAWGCPAYFRQDKLVDYKAVRKIVALIGHGASQRVVITAFIIVIFIYLLNKAMSQH